jgi:hypothetical protein
VAGGGRWLVFVGLVVVGDGWWWRWLSFLWWPENIVGFVVVLFLGFLHCTKHRKIFRKTNIFL